ncbi:hypothetical protein Emed_002507 [Eimeria media]
MGYAASLLCAVAVSPATAAPTDVVVAQPRAAAAEPPEAAAPTVFPQATQQQQAAAAAEEVANLCPWVEAPTQTAVTNGNGLQRISSSVGAADRSSSSSHVHLLHLVLRCWAACEISCCCGSNPTAAYSKVFGVLAPAASAAASRTLLASAGIVEKSRDPAVSA